MTPGSLPPMTAVVLAGDRGGEDPLARDAGVSSRVFVPVGGRPMVLRVLDALQAARAVERILLVGPIRERLEEFAPLREIVDSGAVEWIAPAASPCLSVDVALRAIPEDEAVLVTTADHALLEAHIVDAFCSEARTSGGDLAVGLARYAEVAQAFPGVRRTRFRLRDGGWCGCNLFALLEPRGRKAPLFWRQVEQLRKRPLKVVGVFGWGNLLRYLTRTIDLPQALKRVSAKMDLEARAVILPFPQAAVDVDSVEDWGLAQARTEPG